MSPSSPSAGRRAYALLTLTALLWAGNAAAGKIAVGEVSPQALTCLRWAVACAVLGVVARRPLLAEWDRLLPSWRRVLAMGACGYTLYASLFYAAGTLTSGVNLALLQGSIPVLVILLNLAFYRRAVGAGQALGVAITLVGAAVAASHGDWRVLATLAFNQGDVLMLAACVLYAGYTVALPARPKVSALTFFTAMAAAALLTSLPLLFAEWAAGQTIWPTPKGWFIVAFVGLGPSLTAQLFFMRGVELIGPNRAGLFVNLVPVFGAALAVLLVGEPFAWNDALALALVLGGIVVAERLGRRPAA
ncbi:drug/metabolite transporter (DMT)-like permease [Methylobacterium sp. BE186]|uniref:DMT family transporter n=1 Tax=Methylobacterium sp. BE186 TaxID=2817715 RepID=UPI0028573EF1|nr:DMT family transporter [Methylobacterium sp. BE186]MDR7040155.1 drug/metabolite transporter (DMT)-like permease [Methylobacterium sp. BE186]